MNRFNIEKWTKAFNLGCQLMEFYKDYDSYSFDDIYSGEDDVSIIINQFAERIYENAPVEVNDLLEILRTELDNTTLRYLIINLIDNINCFISAYYKIESEV